MTRQNLQHLQSILADAQEHIDEMLVCSCVNTGSTCRDCAISTGHVITWAALVIDEAASHLRKFARETKP